MKTITRPQKLSSEEIKKISVHTDLSVLFLREGKRFVVYAPALDLSTSGKTFVQASKRFNEIVAIFFEEIIRKGTTGEVLESLGWARNGQRWTPPLIVAHESQSIHVPAVA